MSLLERCYQRDQNIVSRKISEEVILVPIRQDVADLESIYTLNEVGSYIWELIDGRRTVREIKELIIEKYEVDPQAAEADLREFLGQLEEVRAVEEVK